MYTMLPPIWAQCQTARRWSPGGLTLKASAKIWEAGRAGWWETPHPSYLKSWRPPGPRQRRPRSSRDSGRASSWRRRRDLATMRTVPAPGLVASAAAAPGAYPSGLPRPGNVHRPGCGKPDVDVPFLQVPAGEDLLLPRRHRRYGMEPSGVPGNQAGAPREACSGRYGRWRLHDVGARPLHRSSTTFQ